MAEKREKVRLQVSFELPAGMRKGDAAPAIQRLIEHWAAQNPSMDFNVASLKVVRFAVA